MDIKRLLEYDRAYMNMAQCMADLSYAKRSKVGCIILSKQGQVISQGFNGTPTGCDNTCEYEEKIDSNKCIRCEQEHCEGCPNIRLVTKPEVLHAESNAISKCAKWISTTEDGTLYVTLSPCLNCAKLIIQSGIKRVVYRDDYRDDTGIEFLRKNNVKVEKLITD